MENIKSHNLELSGEDYELLIDTKKKRLKRH